MKGRSLGATGGQCANQLFMLAKGSGEVGAEAADGSSPASGKESFWALDIGKVERALLPHPALAAGHPVPTSRRLRGMGMVPKCARGTIESLSARSRSSSIFDPTNPGGALDDGVEDRLHVRGRAARWCSGASAVAV